MLICATCAVEYDEPVPDVCPICADERQWVPAAGQQWTSLDTLSESGQRLRWSPAEPGRVQIRTEPAVGIGQTAQLITTPSGSLLWDPPGYVDARTVELVLDQGPVLAVAASHPHMFGVQTAWAEALDAPVLVCAADEQWLGRRSSRIQFWQDTCEVAPGVRLHRIGGHFPGAAVAHWAEGAEGRGLLLSADTVFPNPDRATVGFMRSYPNNLPLSAQVVRRIADHLAGLRFDAIIGNFGNTISTGAAEAVQRSAQRHIEWVRGDHDHLT